MNAIDSLNTITSIINSEKIKQADQEWGGAGVIISKKDVDEETKNYYNDRYVITDYALELSWLFEELRDIFFDNELIDSCSKIEFFGRLANAAIRFIGRNNDITAQSLCNAVLHEALAIYDEIQEGTFEYLLVAVGNEIFDDYIDEAEKTGYIGPDETIKFLRSLGAEV